MISESQRGTGPGAPKYLGERGTGAPEHGLFVGWGGFLVLFEAERGHLKYFQTSGSSKAEHGRAPGIFLDKL